MASMKHEDSRCLCKCPDVSTVSGVKDDKVCQPEIIEEFEEETSAPEEGRNVYINSSVAPDDCDCKHVVLVRLNLTDAQARSFCPR